MEDQKCKFEDRIIDMAGDVIETKAEVKALSKRINGSIDGFKEHVEHGQKWRVLITSVGVGLILNVIAFAYMYGQLSQTVQMSEKTIVRILEKLDRMGSK